MYRSNARHPGFTLIELLVVISIIALLIAMLMPALGSARRSAQLIQSLSNLKQIGTASRNYATEHDNNLPIDGVKVLNGSRVDTVGYCTWSFGGKFASSYWRTYYNGNFDLAPESRPLNEYLYPGKLHPPVSGRSDGNGPARPRNESERDPIELEIFRSPRDIATMQRQYPNITPGVSSYDDIGTSYHYNLKWLYQLNQLPGVASKAQALDQARAYWRNQQRFDPSRFVVYHDQVADVIRGRYSTNGLLVVDGEYGMDNHSAMVFFDGHADFKKVIGGQNSGPDYDFGFKVD